MLTNMPFFEIHGDSRNLLLPQDHPEGFLSMDSKTEFEYNLLKQPDDWIYRSKPVNYTWNSNGYRCPDWEDINWEDSIVVMGCSLIVGEGLDDSDTISAKMSTFLDTPVINLGVPAGSPDIIYYNTLRLIDAGIKPKAVCILSPSWQRTTYFGEKSENLGLWTLEDTDKRPIYREYYRKYIELPFNAEIHGYMSVRGAYESWKSAGVTVNVWGDHELSPDIDKARDCAHPGIKTIELWADTMSSWVKEVI